MNSTVEGGMSHTNATELQPGTDYTVRLIVRAMNGQVSHPSVLVTGKTLPPGNILYVFCSTLSLFFIISSCKSHGGEC